jgi:sugar/nucleoside kinase (ribokinase family)
VSAPLCLLLGRLQRDTIITADGAVRIDQLGGNLAYAAAACKLWGQSPGLISRVGEDFPAEWVDELASKGGDTRGIRVLDQPVDLRRFIGYQSVYRGGADHPIRQFAERGLAFPKLLLQYVKAPPRLDSKKERLPATLRPEDIPDEYRSAKVAHLCPMDYHSHSLMPAAVRQLGVATVTLDAGGGYMHPEFWNETPALVNGLTVFMAEETRLRMLFGTRTEDLQTMSEAIASYNCQAVLVYSREQNIRFYDRASRKHYQLPAYPARTVDITDNSSSLAGGFAAELGRGQDLLRALLVGSAMASLAAEGSGAFFLADTLPGLVEARAQALEQALRQM